MQDKAGIRLYPAGIGSIAGPPNLPIRNDYGPERLRPWFCADGRPREICYRQHIHLFGGFC